MKAQFVFENVRFERGQDAKDAMKVGRKHDPEVFIANVVVDTNGKPLGAKYDIRKFFQNLEMGLFPSNLFAGNFQDPTGGFIRAGDEAWKGDELKRDGYKEVFFEDKYIQ